MDGKLHLWTLHYKETDTPNFGLFHDEIAIPFPRQHNHSWSRLMAMSSHFDAHIVRSKLQATLRCLCVRDLQCKSWSGHVFESFWPICHFRRQWFSICSPVQMKILLQLSSRTMTIPLYRPVFTLASGPLTDSVRTTSLFQLHILRRQWQLQQRVACDREPLLEHLACSRANQFNPTSQIPNSQKCGLRFATSVLSDSGVNKRLRCSL